jgi:cytochrome c oxidase assembly factor CtaG
MSVERLARAWDLSPPVLVASVLALALFAQGFVRLRRRGRRDHAGWSRAALFTLGTVVLTLALVSPLDAAGDDYLVSAHMLQHLLLGDVAPALLVVSLRGPLAFFVLPRPLLRAAASCAPLRATLGFLVRPKVSFALWALAVGLWHVPRFYDAALARPWLHDLEHLSFLLIGTLVWVQLVDPTGRRVLDVGGRVLYAAALVAVAHVAVHPVLFAGRAVYTPYVDQPQRLFGLTPLADQHWAGIVMTVEQVLTLGTFVVLLLRPRSARRLPRRRDATSGATPITGRMTAASTHAPRG